MVVISVWFLEGEREGPFEVETRAGGLAVEGLGLPVPFRNVERVHGDTVRINRTLVDENGGPPHD